MEEGSGWGTHVYLWRIHFDIWQNQYNIVKLKNKKKFKKEIKKKETRLNKWCKNGTRDVLHAGLPQMFNLLKKGSTCEAQ